LGRAAQWAGLPLSYQDVNEIMDRINSSKDGPVMFEKIPQLYHVGTICEAACMISLIAGSLMHLLMNTSSFLPVRFVQKKDRLSWIQSYGKSPVVVQRRSFFELLLHASFNQIRVILMTSETRLGFVTAYNRAVSHVIALRALWIGNGLNCVNIALEMGIKLFAFDTIKAHVAADPNKVSAGE
jgi:hypothetical protein